MAASNALLPRLSKPRGVSRHKQGGFVRLSRSLARWGSRKFSIRDLFKKGEQGVWYDPSDFSTMFQDSAGTTPVTAVGQPVGLLLDKRLGAVRGPERVTNGDFSAGLIGYTVNSAATASVVGGVLQVTANALAGRVVDQPISVNAGSWYEVTFKSAVTSGSSTRIRLGNTRDTATPTAEYLDHIPSTGTLAPYRYIVRVTAATVYLSLLPDTTGSITLSADDFSIRELPGNHATQATTANRPVLQKDASGFYYLAFNGTNSWLATASIAFTTQGMSVFAGVLKLSDAARGIVAELSSSYSNPNSFGMTAPDQASASFGWHANGGNNWSDQVSSGMASPYAAVLTGWADTSLDAGNGNIAFRVSGVAQSVPIAGIGNGNFGTYPLYIGARAGTSLFFNGRLYSLIVRGAASVAAQIANAERAVGAKMGITL